MFSNRIAIIITTTSFIIFCVLILPRTPTFRGSDDFVSFVSDLSPNRVDTPQQGRHALSGLSTILRGGTKRREDFARIQNETLGVGRQAP